MTFLVNILSVVALSNAIYLRLTEGGAGPFWTFAAIFGMFAIVINTSYYIEESKKAKRFN